MLPLVAIRDRLSARLPLPGVGPRDAPDRQRTLDGAVAWSYDLLGSADQSVLRRLAVFEGGFDLEQASAVVAEPGDDLLDLLLRLAEQHLIEPDERAPGRIRFRMLRTISSFGLGRLREEDDETAARRRHAGAFADLVEASARHIGTSSQPAWIDRLAPDDANVRSATRWAIDAGEVVLAQRLAAAAWRYWNASGQLTDGRALVDAVIDMRDGQDPTSLRAWALAAAGSIAYWQGQPRIAMDRYRAQLSAATAVGDRAAIADAHFNLGHVAYIEGATEAEMLEFAERTTAIYRELGDERGLARSAWAFGIIAMQSGRLEESLALLEGQLELFAANDDPVYHAMTLSSLGWAMFTVGDIPGAASFAVASIQESHAIRDVATTTISLHVGVLMAMAAGRPDDAARLSGAFEGLTDRYGVRPPAALEKFVRALDPFEDARANLPADRWAAMMDEGRSLDLHQAVALITDIGDSLAAA